MKNLGLSFLMCLLSLAVVSCEETFDFTIGNSKKVDEINGTEVIDEEENLNEEENIGEVSSTEPINEDTPIAIPDPGVPQVVHQDPEPIVIGPEIMVPADPEPVVVNPDPEPQNSEEDEINRVVTTSKGFAVLHNGSVSYEGYNEGNGWISFNSVKDSLSSDVKNIYSNGHAFVALKNNGQAFSWGDSYNGGNSSEVDLTNIKEVTYTKDPDYHFGGAFAAIKQNGDVVTWGNSGFGGDSSSVQEDLVNVVKIYPNASNMGGAFAALRKDKRVVSWGNSMAGGDYTEELKEKLVNIVEIYSNKFAYAAITEDRHVVTWGYDSEGGNSDAVQEDLHDVVEITPMGATYEGSFAARTSEGNVVTWGNAWYGGDPSNSGTGVIAASEPLTNIIKVFSTNGAFAAIKGTTLESDSGSVVTWGSSDNGGDSSSVSTLNVKKIFSNRGVSLGLAGAFVALKDDDSIVSWGSSFYGACGIDNSTFSIENVSDVFSSAYAFAVLKKDGSVETWGLSDFGGDSSSVSSQLDGTIRVTDIVSNIYDLSEYNESGVFAARREDGSVVVWGGGEYGYSRGNDTSNVLAYTGLNTVTGIQKIYAESSYFVGIREDGSYIAWGTFEEVE